MNTTNNPKTDSGLLDELDQAFSDLQHTQVHFPDPDGDDSVELEHDFDSVPEIESEDDNEPQLSLFQVAIDPHKDSNEDTGLIQIFKKSSEGISEVIATGRPTSDLGMASLMATAAYYGSSMIKETEEGRKNIDKLHNTSLLKDLLDYKPKELVYLGIDPGKSGGIIALRHDGAVMEKQVMPILGDNLDVAALYDLFKDLQERFTIVVVLEDVHSIFGMSAATNFVFGYVCGAIEAVVLCLKLKLVKVAPKTWQKEIWDNGDKVYKPKKPEQKNPSIDTKATSLCAATRLFPREDLRKSTRSKIPADGIVDAILLAEYGRRKNL